MVASMEPWSGLTSTACRAGVELDQRLGLLMVSLQAIQHGGRLVILADDGLAAAAVANALFGSSC